MNQDSTANPIKKNSTTEISRTLFLVISIFKARYPQKVSCRDITVKSGLPLRKVQRLFKAYQESGWIVGDGQTPQGFKLSEPARKLFNAHKYNSA